LLGDLREEDFAVLFAPDLTADFVGNADPLNREPAGVASPTLSRNAACASS
jgi:hypothetical protein